MKGHSSSWHEPVPHYRATTEDGQPVNSLLSPRCSVSAEEITRRAPPGDWSARWLARCRYLGIGLGAHPVGEFASAPDSVITPQRACNLRRQLSASTHAIPKGGGAQCVGILNVCVRITWGLKWQNVVKVQCAGLRHNRLADLSVEGHHRTAPGILRRSSAGMQPPLHESRVTARLCFIRREIAGARAGPARRTR